MWKGGCKEAGKCNLSLNFNAIARPKGPNMKILIHMYTNKLYYFDLSEMAEEEIIQCERVICRVS